VSDYIPPHHCGRCDARWTGANVCHCAKPGCHLTFGGVGPFDAHQINGKCLNVTASRNFYESRPGVWSHMTEKAREKARTATAKGHSK
jgi:hypothetical protein